MNKNARGETGRMAAVRAMLAGPLLLAALLGGCGAAGPPPATGGESGETATAGQGAGSGAASQPRAAGTAAAPRIEGALERETPKQRKMRIWGSVKRIIEKNHGKLPELETVSKSGVGDPVTEILNETAFKLTIWFAGPCAHQTEVPPRGRILAVFCQGSYHIAAMVDNKEYLPLVRENQQFEPGRGYKLSIIIKQRPQDSPSK